MIEVSLIMFQTLSAKKKKLFDNSMVPTIICFQSQQLPLTHLGSPLLQDPLNKQVLRWFPLRMYGLLQKNSTVCAPAALAETGLW